MLVDELCPPLAMQPDPDNHRQTVRLAACLRALKIALGRLHVEYAEAASMKAPYPHADQLAFPCIREFVDRASLAVCGLTYTEQLTRRVYRAVTSDGRAVLVKFSPVGCCERAHLLLAEADLAPAVLAFRTMEPFWHVTVMDWVDGAAVSPSLKSPALAAQLRRALRILRDNGLVHGDLRPANVLVDARGRLQVIDFEFAGESGVAIYPAILNARVRLPPGVADGAPLEFAHDAFWFAELTGRRLDEPGSDE
jgi:hypothetical protein